MQPAKSNPTTAGRQTVASTPAEHASAAPMTSSPQPSRLAAATETRPEGIGRSGRSRASTSRSNTSLRATPAAYRQPEAASKQSQHPAVARAERGRG